MKQMNLIPHRPDPDFISFAESLISELHQDGRYGTSKTYTKALSSLRVYLQELSGGPVQTNGQLPFSAIDEDFICRYNRHLSRRGVIRNSISFYNRVLRAIYNKGVRHFRIPDNHPFDEAYTGVDRTRKRAVDERTIARLIAFDLSYDKSLELTRDLFIFSYLMRGIPFVDMAYLKKSNISDGYITYRRKKTGTKMDVKLERQLKMIIGRFARKDSEFLLPILQGFDKAAPETLYRRYQARLAAFNRKLKELSKLLGGKVSLSSYVPRHSWATAAHNSDVPIGIISESLGHSSERATRVYLDSFNSRLIDNANRKLIGRIEKFVSLQETNML